MSNYEIDIADMQCWLFRMAETRWKISPDTCAKIFEENKIFNFIADCYDFLHLSSYECALNDVEEMLKNRGITVC